MNLLYIYRRDIHEDDSGASRTIILRENYLASQKDINVYTSFRHLSKVNDNIKELNINIYDKDILRNTVINYNINILCVPEGEYLAKIAREAVEGTKCKVVSEIHTKPNALVYTLYPQTIFNLWNADNILLRLKSLCKLPLLTLFKYKFKQISQRTSLDAYNNSDILVLLSKSFINEFASIYKVEKTKLRYINNPQSFTNLNIDLSKKEKTILVVARLCEPQKRISYILKLWRIIHKSYPDWKLQIVGDGSERKSYERYVQKNKLKNVIFEGMQAPLEYYKKASIFIMTSAIEGWPMTISESMQTGCVPIVMDSFSSVHDLIENNKNGIIVPNNNIKLLVKETRELMDNYQKRNEMAKEALKSIERFNINTIGEQWINLYKSLI